MLWFYALLIVAALLVGLSVAVARAKRSRHPLMLQWCRFMNQRPGIKNDWQRISRLKQEGLISPDADFDGWADESDIVEYEDYKYWLRLHPNPGFNLPVAGYYSRNRGRQKLIRPWEGS